MQARKRRQTAVIVGTAVSLLGMVAALAASDRLGESAKVSCQAGHADLGCGQDAGQAAMTGLPSMRILASKRYLFDGPSAVAARTHHLWVTNVLGNPVTELATTSSNRTVNLPAADYSFDGPNALAMGKHDFWVANAPANSVTERMRKLACAYVFFRVVMISAARLPWHCPATAVGRRCSH
jgi:hypothetical protein